MSSVIPVIDLAKITNNQRPITEHHLDAPDYKEVGLEIVQALTDLGFFYVVNHGFPQQEIERCFQMHKTFFDLPLEIKMKYVRDWKTSITGYLPVADDNIQAEQFEKDQKEHKEVINMGRKAAPHLWPDEDIPGYTANLLSFVEKCETFLRTLILLFGYGMELEDPEAFLKGFSGLGTSENNSQMRAVHYPAVDEIPPGKIRCGEHTDFTGPTLLFLDTTPGLQIFNRQNVYVDVEPHPGVILINIGDLMQRWSGDRLISAKHRVIFRPDTYNRPRYSLIYFCAMDDEYVITPVTGDTNLYPPVKVIDQINRRLADTFIYGKGVDEQLGQEKPSAE